MSDTKLREKADALIAFTLQGPRFIAWVEAVTDALAPAPEKMAKVECVKCGKPQDPNALHCVAFATTDKAHRQQVEYRYTCQPAPPEPAAFDENTPALVGFNKPEPASRKMPEAIGFAVSTLRAFAKDFLKRDSFYSASDASKATKAADALEREWRNLAQPVTVGMTPELSELLSIFEAGAGNVRSLGPDWHESADRSLKLASAVRQQAAQGRKVELPKVRAYLESRPGCKWEYALSELNAAEGKGEGRG